ncbi:MAG: DUF4143 domain-containing protein [Elusimicrobiota bacterium]
MFPLVQAEVPGFDLLRALRNGLIPAHYLGRDPRKSLKAYVFDYLEEEIRAEGLTRNLPAFSRFLDALAFSGGELTNIARDCAVDAKTVKESYQILVDAMVGHLIAPYSKRAGRDIITSTPKFYWFDVGMANALSGESVQGLRGPHAGKLFENYILMEIVAYRGYAEKDFEVKASERVDSGDWRGLKAFLSEHAVRRAVVVCNEPRARRIEWGDRTRIDILPWKTFLEQLWGGTVAG